MEIWKKIKPGRNLKFSDGEALWNAACEYFKWVDANPWYEVKPMSVDKTIEKVKVAKKLPYTLQELESFIGVSHSYFRTFKSENKNTDDPIKLGILAVISEIEKVCYNQQFKGATSGFFNHNIIARALGIKEQVENTNINLNSVELSREEIKNINDELENDV